MKDIKAFVITPPPPWLVAVMETFALPKPRKFDRHGVPRPLEEVPDAALKQLWDRAGVEWESTGHDHAPPGDHYYTMLEDAHLELNLRRLGEYCAV